MTSPTAETELHRHHVPSQRLARNWWAVLIRGLAALAFGVVAIIMPAATIFVLLLFFAGYVLVDGIFAIFAAIRAASEHHRYALLLLEGVFDLLLAAAIIVWPFEAFLGIIYITAAWAIVTGAFMLVGAFRMTPHHGKGWFILGGLASIVWGVALGIAPYLGALVFTWWFAAYAMVFGVVLIALAFKLRSQHVEGQERA
jgi:uncharacterized membrane protein HdeD (DUF308 family)